ncbi:hypothetical protein AVEN_84259-1 [Araneus ventricosus]|uniref:Uncharacterized protein n=1 Tax=Araneus ventricosus TaxID=182803 RepID=A0A4Y2J1B2_ARAVE|nr:hypothetical protein AVEN_84259-1 [Araneus ventricosus]
MVPHTLRALMESLQVKKRDHVNLRKKFTTIAHAIISTIRLQYILSPNIHGVALLVNRKFGSKSLINLLSRFGFCAYYDEAKQLELSAICQTLQPTGTFCQNNFDNADFNVATLDGLNTFPRMRGVNCIIPFCNLPPAHSIKRLKSVPTAGKVGTVGVLELLSSEYVRRAY